MEEKFVLSKAIMIDGEEKKELTYNFEELTGQDINEIFEDIRKAKHAVVSAYEMDPIICAAAFAKAAGIDFTDILRFKGKDFINASNLGRSFFIPSLNGGQESENSEE